MTSTKLHFKEIDWVLYFPFTGNQGRSYPKYGVAYRNFVTGESQPGRRINLEDVLRRPEVHDHYPYTIGLYRESTGKGASFAPHYLETRTVASEAELFKWLDQLGI